MSSYTLGIFASLGVTGFVVEMLRRGYLREKFAALWLLVSLLLLVLAVFPELLGWVADLVGIQIPSNLLFMGAGMLLLLVSVQLSYEISRLEARTRRLAEEMALLRSDIERIKDQ